ncbi:MAG: type II toxin-antitoxin system Phd/YefM family antitoxin [Thiomargarita sp.]|nr:type II toxin-antitoxin system Phd/YefM family antitoxin [Thiomargarita sp.]
MQTINYSIVEKQLQSFIMQVRNNHEPLCIESSTKDKAILLAEEDYNSLIETLYLLNNPVNAEKLMQAAQRRPEQAVSWKQAKADLGFD